MRQNTTRYLLIGLETVVGLGGIYGGIRLLDDARGFGVREEWLQGSPFSDYRIPALALLIGVAGSALLAAAALLRGDREWGALLSIVAGSILMVFEIAETYSFGLRNFQQPLMFVFGLAMAFLGAVLWRRVRGRQVIRRRVAAQSHAHLPSPVPPRES